MFIVPMDTPGITVVPMQLMSEHDINQVFYDDVRVPATNLVGGENNGWTLITNQLNHERVTLCSSGHDRAASHRGPRAGRRRRSCADGRRVIDQEWVQVNLARVHARLEFLRLINWKVAWAATAGAARRRPTRRRSRCSAPSSTSRRFRLLMEIIGQAGYLRRGLARARSSKARLESLYRSLLILTFGGGINEVQRDLIAMFGLGMPRAKR